LTYNQLVDRVNKNTTVSTTYKARSYTDFVVNCISAIVHNIDILLVDYRNSKKEIEGENLSVENNSLTNSSLISKIKNSTSRVGL